MLEIKRLHGGGRGAAGPGHNQSKVINHAGSELAAVENRDLRLEVAVRNGLVLKKFAYGGHAGLGHFNFQCALGVEYGPLPERAEEENQKYGKHDGKDRPAAPPDQMEVCRNRKTSFRFESLELQGWGDRQVRGPRRGEFQFVMGFQDRLQRNATQDLANRNRLRLMQRDKRGGGLQMEEARLRAEESGLVGVGTEYSRIVI
jgi:hypothetical protein